MNDFTIGFTLFPNITQLDLTGPLQVLSRVPGAKVVIAAKTSAPVPTDCGLALLPTTTFDACPQLDLICIPGGGGVVEAMQDAATIDFVAAQAAGARYVTAVCTGAFLLGIAGLLRGRRATTHWAYTQLLPLVGATYERARMVRDGDVITAGGVTAGIDFGLTVAAEIAGETAARSIQLSLEYDPAPPFDAGNPDHASPVVRGGLDQRYAEQRTAYRRAIARAPVEARAAGEAVAG